MAKIQTYLDKILSAVYGKDVRSSIYDSIKAMNDEVEENREAEKARIANEERRNSSEKQRDLNEKERANDETKRQQAEESRKLHQKEQEKLEKLWQENESQRQDSEGLRLDAEEVRKTNEQKRMGAESDRLESEKLRVIAEGSRKALEIQRKSEYDRHAEEEHIRTQNEEIRKASEERREKNEIKREEKFNSLSSRADEKLQKMDDAISGKSVTDKSLSIEGQAADAKETGRRFEETKKEISKLSTLTNNKEVLEFGFGECIKVDSIDEGWTPDSDGILQIILTTTDYDGVTMYAISKMVNGEISDDIDTFIYGLQRKGMMFEVVSVPIKKGIQYKTAMKENVENVHIFFYPFEVKNKGGN